MTDGRRTGSVGQSSSVLMAESDEGRARTDSDLLRASVVDPEAFGLFFDRHYGPLLAYFLARVRSPENAADLCAETLAAALDGVARFDTQMGSARQWLYGIAHHKLSRYWRELRVSRESRDRLGIGQISVDTATIAAFTRAEAHADREALFAALDRLPPDQAAAVRLRILDELDYSEVARILGCREGAARVRVHRGLKRLETEFEAG